MPHYIRFWWSNQLVTLPFARQFAQKHHKNISRIDASPSQVDMKISNCDDVWKLITVLAVTLQLIVEFQPVKTWISFFIAFLCTHLQKEYDNFWMEINTFSWDQICHGRLYPSVRYRRIDNQISNFSVYSSHYRLCVLYISLNHCTTFWSYSFYCYYKVKHII